MIFEGVLPMETKLMLSSFLTEKKLFSIDFLNQRVASFHYGKAEARNKLPKPLEKDKITSGGNKLPLSGMNCEHSIHIESSGLFILQLVRCGILLHFYLFHW